MFRMLAVSLLSMVLFCGPAWAEAWDLEGGAGLVYGSTFRSDEKDGLGFQAYFDLGLTETLSLTAGGGYARHFVGDGGAYSLGNIGFGIVYNIDVLVVVPFASVRVGWMLQDVDEGESNHGFGVSVAVGFDYLVTEYFTLGFAAEYHGMLSNLDAFPAYAAFTSRMGFRLPY
jgi:hypothetical protein